MNTKHLILNSDSRDLSQIASETVQLVVTSPPYPMIEMWDELFSSASPEIRECLNSFDGDSAFELMHLELDKVWREVYRVLGEGCFACINIGDATRSIGNRFQLFSNHSRITQSFKSIGFDVLPVIIWKKTTNAPNKFMGSGMLPAGAYVTLEHEYILVFRKGGKRIFSSLDDRKSRNESAYFWEERNKWFSDTWDLKGVAQKIIDGQSRDRSAAYPLELAFRLINMYSLAGETVLDPFAGIGTTSIAALSCARNSVGVEIDNSLISIIGKAIMSCKDIANTKTLERINLHKQFIDEYLSEKGELKYKSSNYGFPVMTKQEIDITLYAVNNIMKMSDRFEYSVEHSAIPKLSETFSSLTNTLSTQLELAI